MKLKKQIKLGSNKNIIFICYKVFWSLKILKLLLKSKYMSQTSLFGSKISILNALNNIRENFCFTPINKVLLVTLLINLYLCFCLIKLFKQSKNEWF